MRTKAKEVLISQTCNNAYKGKKGSTDLSDLSLNRWLYDTAIQQGANRVSCQVTVIVVVTDNHVSSTFHFSTSLSSFIFHFLSFSLLFNVSSLVLALSSVSPLSSWLSCLSHVSLSFSVPSRLSFCLLSVSCRLSLSVLNDYDNEHSFSWLSLYTRL